MNRNLLHGTEEEYLNSFDPELSKKLKLLRRSRTTHLHRAALRLEAASQALIQAQRDIDVAEVLLGQIE